MRVRLMSILVIIKSYLKFMNGQKTTKNKNGKSVSDGFIYTSNNSERMTKSDLQKWLDANKNNIGKINYEPYGRQEIIENDIKEVEKILRSEFLTQGPTVEKFEEAVSKYCGTKYAVAVNSTSALHLACLALELGPGDTLWTSSAAFVAVLTAESIVVLT